MVFSEIDFLNSNPSNSNSSCKRKNQNERSFSRIRHKSGHEQDMIQYLSQDTDETSSLHDSVHCKDRIISAKERVCYLKLKVSSADNLLCKNKKKKPPEERGKTSNNRKYSKPFRQKQSRINRAESTLSDSSRVLSDDEKNDSSSNNQLPVNYLKSSCSPSRVDKTPKSQDEQNIKSSHFVSEQKNKVSRCDKVQSLPNNTNGSGSSQKKCSQIQKGKKVTSSYFADRQTSNDKCKEIEQKDNPFLTQHVSPRFRLSVVDSEKQSSAGDYKDPQVVKFALKSEDSISKQEKMTNNGIESCAEQCPSADKGTTNLQNYYVTSLEENERVKIPNDSDSEKMVIHFDPSWIKRNSLLSSHSLQLRDQNTVNSDNKSETYQSRRLSHAVVSECAKIE